MRHYRAARVGFIAIAALTTACMSTPTRLDPDQLARLRQLPTIHVIHYAAAPLLAFGPNDLNPRFGPALAILADNMIVYEQARYRGEQLATRLRLEDPTATVVQTVLDDLRQYAGFNNLRLASSRFPSDANTYIPDVIARLRQALGPVTALEFTAPTWILARAAPDDRIRYRVNYSIGARIWDLAEGDLLWTGSTLCATSPALYQAEVDGPSLRAELLAMADRCSSALTQQIAAPLIRGLAPSAACPIGRYWNSDVGACVRISP